MNRIVVVADKTSTDDADDGPGPFLSLAQSPAQGTLHLLQGRDQCSDVFGAGTTNSVCAPSTTLCCIKPGKDYPSCQQALGKEWCCVGKRLISKKKSKELTREGSLLGISGTNDNCYADQPSACTEPNSVPCTNLSPGTKKACCPPLTSCADRKQGSHVRCEIAYPDLMALAGGGRPQSSSSSSDSQPEMTSSSSFASSTTSISSQSDTAAMSSTSAADATPMPNPPMSGGVIAGITVGVVLFLLLAGAVTRYFPRRRRAMGKDGTGYENERSRFRPS
ncbi:hypothetical protein PG993_007855 [Apiospora rasikravindrae]|uniref:Mid2 domain-containing protein n=1 Tax=Apiospora rasikravindrae TaxID=990691 RepID=A0ABR1SYN8_9PEZI